MPSSMPARAAVSSSIEVSAAARSPTPGGQWQALYFMRGPSTARKKAAGTS